MNMEISVKRFEQLTGAELYEILRCRTQVFVVEQDIPYQDMDNADQVSTHVFAQEDGRIKAYLRIIDPEIKRSRVHIGRVLVMKEYRGKGIARELMRCGIKIGKTMSKQIEISAQTYLIDFYKSLGFEVTSEVFEMEGRPHVSMILK